MKEINITIVNWAGVNTGDDAIFSALLDLITNGIQKNLKIFVLADNDHLIKAKYNINDATRIFEFYKFRNLVKVMNFLKNSELIIYGGGDLINNEITSISFIGLAKILGLPVICSGVGAVPIKSRFIKFYMRTILNHVDLITLRDKESKYLIEEMGINKPPIHLTSDIAFLLKPDLINNRLIRSLDKLIEDPPLTIGVNIRKYDDAYSMHSKWDEEVLQERIAELCDMMVAKYHAKIVFLPMVIKERTEYYHQGWKSDDILSQEVVKRMKEKKHALIINGDYSAKEFEGLLSKLDLVIAMRLHALLLAANVGVPIIALDYAPKVKSFMKLMELSNYSIPIENITENRIIKAVDKIIKNREMKVSVKPQQILAKKNLEMIKKVLEKSEKKGWKFYLFSPSALLISLINYLYSIYPYIKIFTRENK